MRRLALCCAVLAGAVACGGSEAEVKEPKATASDERVELGERPDTRRSTGPGTDDDDAGDGMEVEGLKGHLEPYDIQKGVEKRSKALGDCYHGKLGGRRFVGGKIEMAYVVNRDGTVKTVTMSKSDLGSWDMEKCLLDVARSMTFKKPRGGEAEFSVPLEFNPRNPPIWWGDDRASAEVTDKLQELAACNEKAGEGPADLWITAYVTTRGKIASVGFAAPDGGLSDEWAACAAEVVSAWELGDPRGKVAKLSFRYGGE